jgi:hypothetical protein
LAAEADEQKQLEYTPLKQQAKCSRTLVCP